MNVKHVVIAAAAGVALLAGACKGQSDPADLPAAPTPSFDGAMKSTSGSGWSIGCPEGWNVGPPDAHFV